ncbi:hypothetical protein UFOVP71_126 [uncultured Caudovirales phage]|uniref:Uncharacterized protein n=1 Tax=uncultured Caudovirales phage TaxID=2100421 RepID=A0A6J5T9G9_9CAUD|nr:hypothetical protein UFOVP71_126 [uncultured Caudovirales phage]
MLSDMNKQIKELIAQVPRIKDMYDVGPVQRAAIEDFVELIVEATLTQVAERAYYTGDRDWSDEIDRPWIQLEFGYGTLADAQKGIFK